MNAATAFAEVLNPTAAWVTIFTGPLTVLALVLAWGQLRRTAQATEAAQTAINRTARNLALYQVLVLIPEMQAAESSLDGAIAGDDHGRAQDVLNQWRKTGAEVRGLLEARAVDADLFNGLQQSFADAYVAKSRLHGNPTPTVFAATQDFRTSMGRVTIMLGTLAGQLRANIGDDTA